MLRRLRRLSGGFRPTPATCGRTAGHLARAVVAEVGGFRAPPGVGIGEAKCRAFSFTDFLAAIVADENGLSSHISSQAVL
jgi:hypothetical protein